MTELPDRRQHGYSELEKKLQDDVNEIELRQAKFFRGALLAFAIIGIACAIALLGFGLVLRKQSHVTELIQLQRYIATLDNCLDTNVRHDNVLARIDDAVKQTPLGKPRERAEKGAKPFKLILEAAVPYTSDCREYSHRRVPLPTKAEFLP